MQVDKDETGASDTELDKAIEHWLRTSKPGQLIECVDQERLLHRIDLHGVGPILALQSADADLPRPLEIALRQRLLASELWEAQHRRLLSEALCALSNEDLQPLLLKGTALAYSHYPRPSARPRGDTDVLVREAKREQAKHALEAAGFRPVPDAGGDIVKAEALFQKEDLSAALHDFDIHWRVNSSAVIQKLFTEDGLFERSVLLPGLSSTARRMGDLDALLFASVHRRLHVDGNTQIYMNGAAYPVIDRLIWLLDIDVLFRTLSQNDLRVLLKLARKKDLISVLKEALQSAHDRLGTDIPDWFQSEMKSHGPEVSEIYVTAGAAKKMLMNFTATEGLNRKATFLRELFFPPAVYMRTRFAKGHLDWLPVLYLRRISSGFQKLILKQKLDS